MNQDNKELVEFLSEKFDKIEANFAELKEELKSSITRLLGRLA